MTKCDFRKNGFWAQIETKIAQKRLKNDDFGYFTNSNCRMFVKLHIRIAIDDFQRMIVARVWKEEVLGARLVEKTLQNEPKSGFC